MAANPEHYERMVLDSLPQADRDVLEEEALTDGETFERLLIAEDELIDQVARGDLPETDRRRFDETLGRLPRVKERLAIASLLAQEADHAAAKRRIELASRRTPFGARFGDFWRRQPRTFQYALATVVLLFAISWPTYRLIQGPSGEALTLVLQPLNLRSIEEDTLVAVEASVAADRLELLLELDFDPGARLFEAVIHDHQGHEVLRRTDLKPEPQDWNVETIVVELPLRKFSGSLFEIRLLGSETRQEVAIYRFHVASR